ncbi:Jerky -like [Araneus ventricosus]|uniref:Jerky-like n=1 Tax=Araneus ventricosus TaxID=182803 RepID=A0A4Y2G9M8_ARAVE|nr:Jerky -like [Araneus ventricosus]
MSTTWRFVKISGSNFLTITMISLCILRIRESEKRKRTVVSLETKIDALKKLDKGQSIKSVAFYLGVREVTVGDWKRNRVQIETFFCENASCHLYEEQLASGEIKAYFLPPNVTSLIQPLNQAVLENLKRNYRKKLLGKLIKDLEEQRVTECLKEITQKDAVYWIAEAWKEIESTTLQKSWRKILPSEQANDESEASDDKSLLSLAQTLPETLTEKDIAECMTADEQQEITDDMIADMVENREQESSDDKNYANQKKIAHSEGLSSIEKTIEYIEQQEEVTPTNLMTLTKWRNIAAKKLLSSHKQKNIKDFFKSTISFPVFILLLKLSLTGDMYTVPVEFFLYVRPGIECCTRRKI